MKFCLSSRLSSQYLKTADQIKIPYRDIESLPVISESYPNAEIIVCLPQEPTENDIKLIKQYTKLHQKNIILAFNGFPSSGFRNEYNYYTTYPVESFSEANALIANGVYSLKIGCPLFFQLDKLKTLNTQIRLTPNQSWTSVVPRKDGICGQWIRPEDLHRYECLDNVIIEFDFCHISQEEALYRIYSDEQKWPGPLSYLVHDLNNNCLNRLLPKDIGEKRLNCGHKCQDPTSICRICPNAFKLASMVEAKYAVDKN